MSEHLGPNLLSWASELDDVTREQALRISRSPVLAGHVALMPDAHLGIGATIGTVLPTQTAIIPSAVGVDIGCGMAAVETDVVEAELPDDLDPVLASWQDQIPSGVGRGHQAVPAEFAAWIADHELADIDKGLLWKAGSQFGVLGAWVSNG